MAIRFLCASCSQPIEVDEEWALKLVACPYCRKTVTAPVESQIGDESSVPTARGFTDEADAPVPPPLLQEQVPRTSNGAAIIAFVLGCVLLACIIVSLVLMKTHGDELRVLSERIQQQMQQGKGMMESTELASDELFGGDVPAALAVASFFQCAAIPLWIATLVCGIIGVTRTFRRGYAILALSAAAATPPILCFGTAAITLWKT